MKPVQILKAVLEQLPHRFKRGAHPSLSEAKNLRFCTVQQIRKGFLLVIRFPMNLKPCVPELPSQDFSRTNWQ